MSGVVWQHQRFANIQVSFHLGGFLFLVSLPEAPPCRSRGRLPDLLSNLFLSTLPPCASINRTIKFLSHRLSHRLCSNDARSTKTNTAGYMFSIDFNSPLKKNLRKNNELVKSIVYLYRWNTSNCNRDRHMFVFDVHGCLKLGSGKVPGNFTTGRLMSFVSFDILSLSVCLCPACVQDGPPIAAYGFHFLQTNILDNRMSYIVCAAAKWLRQKKSTT